MDLVGLLEKSKTSSCFILVIIDYTTLYTDAIPLHIATPPNIEAELMKMFALVEILKKILTDQGTNVTSHLMAKICCLLCI